MDIKLTHSACPKKSGALQILSEPSYYSGTIVVDSEGLNMRSSPLIAKESDRASVNLIRASLVTLHFHQETPFNGLLQHEELVDPFWHWKQYLRPQAEHSFQLPET
jgi:hypothetical protein